METIIFGVFLAVLGTGVFLYALKQGKKKENTTD